MSAVAAAAARLASAARASLPLRSPSRGAVTGIRPGRVKDKNNDRTARAPGRHGPGHQRYVGRQSSGRQLGRHGAHIIVHGRDPVRGGAVAGAITSQGGTARFAAADLGPRSARRPGPAGRSFLDHAEQD